jgi:hypothetical protein
MQICNVAHRTVMQSCNEDPLHLLSTRSPVQIDAVFRLWHGIWVWITREPFNPSHNNQPKSIMKTSLLLAALFVMSLSAQAQVIDGDRPNGQQGLTEFENPKGPLQPFDGVKVRIGGFFSQDLQMLKHENNATPLMFNGSDRNKLMKIGNNFNTAQANLDFDVQLERGVHMHLTTYLSSRHHNEAWVKGGYIQFDALPFLPFDVVDKIMENVTIKVGHNDVNHGDVHYRRTDGGNGMYNPFVENYIMDAFSTEIGGEVQFKKAGFLGSVTVTNGEINGRVEVADKIAPSYIVKVGYDTQLNDDLRVRLTGSMYTTKQSNSNTLHGGDRTGSRYYLVLASPIQSVTPAPNGTATTAANTFTSGRFNPGFRNEITSIIINPYVKFQGIEFFGNVEFASGASATETDTRAATQYAADLVYRFGATEQFYVAGRYNTVASELLFGAAKTDITINRIVGAAGWFVTPNILAKLEYVTQTYDGYPAANLLSEAKFSGLMISANVGF